MTRRALTRSLGGRALIALTTALGACVATGMLSVVFDVGDKVNSELSAYGANIVVQPKGAAVISELYDTGGLAPAGSAALREDQVAAIKNIFWAFNITNFTPFLTTRAALTVRPDGTAGEAGATVAPAAYGTAQAGPEAAEPAVVVGTWFDKALTLASGEHARAGLINLRSWWDVDGGWIADGDAGLALVGSALAAERGIGLGSTITVAGEAGALDLRVAGIVHTGGSEDSQVIAPLDTVQRLSGREGEVDRVEVAALTTPENELARRAAQNPASLSVSEWETWYCTAYASAIAYQISEVMDGSVAKPVRAVTESQGAILTKTQLLMLLVGALALAGSALAIANLVTASVMERSAEIGLLKAVGAADGAVVRLILAELAVVGVIGGLVGYGLGLGVAQVIGHAVFGSAIAVRPVVALIVAVLVLLVVLAGALPSIRLLLRLRPADVLHGR